AAAAGGARDGSGRDVVGARLVEHPRRADRDATVAPSLRRRDHAGRAAVHHLSSAVRADVHPAPRRHRRRRRDRKADARMTGDAPLWWYLVLSAVLFGVGTMGVLMRRNLIVMFMAIELMLNAVNLTFVTFARSSQSMDGHVIVFFVMAVAAAESAVGLPIVLQLFRLRATVNADEVTTLRW